MALFAPVAPWQVYQAFYNAGVFPKAYLLLAHDVLANAEHYATIRKHLALADVLIMDNSVIELGTAEGLKPTIQAARVVGAKVIVLPDELEKSEKTVQLTSDAWSDYMSDGYLQQEFEVMAVPQGESLELWIDCLEQMRRNGVNPQWLGIPRNTTTRIIASRSTLVDIAKTFYPQAKIHLLGFSKWMPDDYIVAQDPRVVSIDSAVPVRLASKDYRNSMIFDGGTRGKWWDTVIDDLKDMDKVHLMIQNYQEAQQWCTN